MKNNILNRYFNNNRAAKAIYGIILITVMLLGLFHTNQGIVHILISLFIGGFTIVFAEIYSEILGETIKKKGQLDRVAKKNIWSDTLVISSVSIYPLIVFLLAYVHIISKELAFKISFTGLLLGLSFFGYLAACASGKNNKKALIEGVLSGAAGLLIIYLKYKFTH